MRSQQLVDCPAIWTREATSNENSHRPVRGRPPGARKDHADSVLCHGLHEDLQNFVAREVKTATGSSRMRNSGRLATARVRRAGPVDRRRAFRRWRGSGPTAQIRRSASHVPSRFEAGTQFEVVGHAQPEKVVCPGPRSQPASCVGPSAGFPPRTLVEARLGATGRPPS